MIKQNRKFKVALIGDCLSGGGAEKVHSVLSIYFQNAGLEVQNCVFTDWVSYKYSGSLLNLGKINPHSFFVIRKIKRFFVLKKFIRENDFDYVIDFRMRTNFLLEFLISKHVYPKGIFYTVHNGVLEYYFPKSSFLSHLIYKNRNCIAASKAIKAEILSRKLADKVDYIYYPIDFSSIDSSKNEFEVNEGEYILAAGRMHDIKQFDKLILAYSKSLLPGKKIKLIILGEGQKKTEYINLVAQLGLEEFVIFKGFVDNPFPYYKNALFLVLSSKNEGFPNVIIEALAVNTPVISFDCFTGPKEMITHKENGLLIEDQNFTKLTEAINSLTEDQELYRHCKANASQSVQCFSLEKIGGQWLDYMKNNVS